MSNDAINITSTCSATGIPRCEKNSWCSFRTGLTFVSNDSLQTTELLLSRLDAYVWCGCSDTRGLPVCVFFFCGCVWACAGVCVCTSCIDVKLQSYAGGQQPIFLCCPTKLRKMWWMGSWTHEPVPALCILFHTAWVRRTPARNPQQKPLWRWEVSAPNLLNVVHF